ncbi:hypothetical protein [Thermococcus sp.]
MTMVETVKELKKIESKAEREYKVLLKKLKDSEYADLRVLILRMAVDTILHRRIVEALEKAYKDALKLVEDFGYGEEIELPEDAPRLQVSQDVVLIPGMPAMVLAPYGPLGSRIPPEEALRELLKNMPEDVVIPEEKLEELRKFLSEFTELSEGMKGNYKKLERKAIHPILRAFAREAARNEEQPAALLERLLEKYGK